ncbi:hypothetical protein [Botrimarina colliarenosi]|uniref:hypothetical protein n=1 Tax=Botrimarina colliarenosi TaxID=2528001 RepID=UPI0011B619D3|nr:hypothetical protein [Botrimarina colliarenosi]
MKERAAVASSDFTPLSPVAPPKPQSGHQAWLLPVLSGGGVAIIATIIAVYFASRSAEPRDIDGGSSPLVATNLQSDLTPSAGALQPESEDLADAPTATSSEPLPDEAADSPTSASLSAVAEAIDTSGPAKPPLVNRPKERHAPGPTKDRFNVATVAASPPTATESIKSQKPLAQIVEFTSLPLLMAIDSALTTSDSKPSKTVLLGKAEPDLLKELVVKIDQPKTRAVQRASFYAETVSENGEALVELRLKAESTSNLVRTFEEPVAKIYVREGALIFEWLDPKYAAVADRLRNCVLQLDHQNESKRICLREAKLIDCHKVNLQEVKSEIPITGDYLPAKEAMALQVTGTYFGGNSSSMRPETGVVEANRDLDILIEGAPLPIKFQVRLTSNEEGPCVTVIPRFQLGKRWRSYSAERVTEAIAGLEKSIVDNERAIKRAQRDLPNAKSRLSSVRAELSRAKGPRAVFLHGQAQSLDTQITGLESKIRRLSDAIPESKQLAKDMYKLVTIGNELHLNAEIGFRVYVPTESGEYDVLRSPLPSKRLPVSSSRGRTGRPT